MLCHDMDGSTHTHVYICGELCCAMLCYVGLQNTHVSRYVRKYRFISIRT